MPRLRRRWEDAEETERHRTDYPGASVQGPELDPPDRPDLSDTPNLLDPLKLLDPPNLLDVLEPSDPPEPPDTPIVKSGPVGSVRPHNRRTRR